MWFLVDIDVSGFLVDDPMPFGHDVISVADKDPRMWDENILQGGEQQRIIVTTDQDVEGMIWRQGKPHCGVLRLGNLPAGVGGGIQPGHGRS
ncbi:MAG: DUF5615 family PIN-like protein [Candidatus Competibacteraceae bacterium]|nr:DUF5615 family PIN-like protein [Candidatus Competibacteraceae bacterium]